MGRVSSSACLTGNRHGPPAESGRDPHSVGQIAVLGRLQPAVVLQDFQLQAGVEADGDFAAVSRAGNRGDLALAEMGVADPAADRKYPSADNRRVAGANRFVQGGGVGQLPYTNSYKVAFCNGEVVVAPASIALLLGSAGLAMA